MLRQPTLKQLKYLCTVAKTQHFGQAARDCHVSQSTLSTAIHDLEKQLCVTLLERNSKHVHLTPIGKEIVSLSHDILSKVSDLVSLCNASEKLFHHELRLGVIPTIAPYLLPSLLTELRNKYTQFKLYFQEGLSAALIEHLHAGELDVLLLALPYPTNGTDSLHLFYDEFLLVCPSNHPLANTQPLHLKDLDHQELLLLEDGHCLRDHAIEACKLDKSALPHHSHATTLNTLVQLVASGMGITLLPKMAINNSILTDTAVTAKPFSEKKVRRSIGLLWRNNSPQKKEFERLGQLLQRLWHDNQ